MAGQLKKVLIVDDDRFAQKLIVRALSTEYELASAADGQQAIDKAISWQPSVILLDVEMPIKNGYEVCETLKSNPDTSQIPIIFLSGNGSLRERLIGFELGAEDYLVKPFEADLLNAKVRLAVNTFHEKSELNEKAIAAQETAFEALTVSAELGRALRFVEHAFAVSSFDALAAALFKSLEEFGLSASVMFVTLSGPQFFSSGQVEVPPLEQDLLQRMHTQGRFSDFGCRTFCNYRQVSLLIKNMPLDNLEKYGRIKDTVPFMLGSVDGKVRALDVHRALMTQADSLAYSVSSIGQTLTSLTEKVVNGHNNITNVMRSLMTDLDARLPKLGLEDDQEKYLTTRIDTAFAEALAELDRSLVLGNSLNTVVRLLAHLQLQQQKLADSMYVQPEAIAENLPDDGASLSSDFEMF